MESLESAIRAVESNRTRTSLFQVGMGLCFLLFGYFLDPSFFKSLFTWRTIILEIFFHDTRAKFGCYGGGMFISLVSILVHSFESFQRASEGKEPLHSSVVHKKLLQFRIFMIGWFYTAPVFFLLVWMKTEKPRILFEILSSVFSMSIIMHLRMDTIIDSLDSLYDHWVTGRPTNFKNPRELSSIRVLFFYFLLHPVALMLSAVFPEGLVWLLYVWLKNLLTAHDVVNKCLDWVVKRTAEGEEVGPVPHQE